MTTAWSQRSSDGWRSNIAHSRPLLSILHHHYSDLHSYVVIDPYPSLHLLWSYFLELLLGFEPVGETSGRHTRKGLVVERRRAGGGRWSGGRCRRWRGVVSPTVRGSSRISAIEGAIADYRFWVETRHWRLDDTSTGSHRWWVEWIRALSWRRKARVAYRKHQSKHTHRKKDKKSA